MMKLKKPSVFKIIVGIWLIFATLYFVLGEYNRLNTFVAQNAYNAGYQDFIVKLISEVSNCKPVPVTVGTQTVEILAISCLQQVDTPQPGAENVPVPEVK